jgi:hypothetical protein
MSSTLAEALVRCVRVCEATLEDYGAEEETGTQLVSSLVLAVAGVERAVEADADDPGRPASLAIAATLCRDAAGSVRRYGLDPSLLRCAEACDRAAYLCERALTHSR